MAQARRRPEAGELGRRRLVVVEAPPHVVAVRDEDVQRHVEPAAALALKQEYPNLLDDEDAETAESGYVMLDADGRFDDNVSGLPEHWLTPGGKVKKDYRPHQPRHLFARADGRIETERRLDRHVDRHFGHIHQLGRQLGLDAG